MSTLPSDTESAVRRELLIGDWRVNLALNALRRGGDTVRVEPKAIEVLQYLAARPGEVVGREELLSAIWTDVVVGDDALTQAIIKLRKALGDDAHRPRYIETISKRGYRLIAHVAHVAHVAPIGRVATDEPLPSNARMPETRSRWVVRHKGTAWTIVGSLAILAIGTVLLALDVRWPIASDDKIAALSVAPPVIAVLPLSNLSGDPKRDYFSDGVTEDIINALGRFSSVRVISRNSVVSFKTWPATPEAVRTALGARYMLTGSVRESDGALRVSVELSDTEKSVVLWSGRFDGKGSDIFGIQDKIVLQVVGKLAGNIARLEQKRAASKPPENLEAYDLVLRARPLYANVTRASNRTARAYLEKAMALAPNYAEAYVGMAMSELQRVLQGWLETPAESLQRAENLLQRALAINGPGSNASAHGALSAIYSIQGKFEQALAEADRALELNPSDAFVHDRRGSTLLYMGRLDEAYASMELAMRFNPADLGISIQFDFALLNYTMQRYREALLVTDRAIARYPDVAGPRLVRAAALAQLGNQEEARKEIAQVRRLSPFIQAEHYGSRFVDPQHRALIIEGLLKAGL